MNNDVSSIHLIKVSSRLFLLAFFLLALYGGVQPWPPAEQPLKVYGRQIPIMIGIATKTARSELVSRSYILFPMVFSQPKAITVTQLNDEPPVISESVFRLFLYIAIVVYSLVGTWWCRSKNTKGRKPQ